MSKRHIYPFTAIVGQEKMKEALILNIVNPTLSGVLIRGEKGTAKSTAVRALAQILPAIEVVKECPFQHAPDETHSVCRECIRSECSRKILDNL
ncbi:MAG: magnesium chelatase ATPase subunit I, partial [Desulfobacteraceae bacterium]